MRSTLLCLTTLGISISSANAATLSLRWQGTSSDRISLSPSDSAVIEVVMELSAVGSLGTVYFRFEPLSFVTHESNSTDLAGWDAGGFTGVALGSSQFAVAAVQVSDTISGPATVVVGEALIHFGSTPSLQEWEVAIDDTAGPGIVLLDPSGRSYTHGSGFAGIVPNFFSVGKGSGGIPDIGLGGSPRDPLIITFPEPTSLALLAVGGSAVLIRRKKQFPKRVAG